MRLRQLRIKGFKSFANDTIINFNEDVIGIVGPNGSGKSNIVDAIRWVLGEQKTKELRLERMTDVIFNGTKTRKKSGIAQVTLSFENSKNILPVAYNNVDISRILYRSGESEYRLNNVPCRLKDITNLFRDTGIGSNSYAILALGMVDDLLADKENARRRMFEQAAGISKFKNRKKETLNKLKATSADLDRVEDLLFEIEKNIKSLERQARRAKRYLKIKESYQSESIQLALVSINQYKDNYKELADKIKKEEDIYREITVKQRTLEAGLEKIQEKNLSEEIKLSQKQKELNSIVYQIREEENKKGILDQKMIFANQNIKSSQESIATDKVNLSQLVKESKTLEQLLEKDQNSYKSIKKLLDEHKLVYENLKSIFEKAKHSNNEHIARQNELQKNVFRAEKQIAIYNNNIDNLASETAKTEYELANYKKQSKSATKELKHIDKKLKLEKSELVELKNESNKLHEQQEQIQQSIKDDKETLSRINRNLDAKQNEHDLLKSMIDNLEGFPESIKYLNKKWKKDVPLLSDLISCDDKYRAALEQYLEPYFNHFVIKDVKEGLQAIDILTETQKGKAHFFLLDSIPLQSLNTKSIKGATSALSIIEIDKAYTNLFELLLNGVYITNDKNIIKSEKLDNDIVLLSQSGDFYRTNHTLSGGSVGLFGGKKIGRKKSLKKLSKLLKAFQKDANDIQSSIVKYENKLAKMDMDSIEKRINDVEQKIKTTEREFLILESRKKNQENNLDRIQEKAKRDKESLEDLKDKKQGESTILKQLRSKLEKLNSERNSSEELDKYSKNMSKASEQYNTTNVNFIRQENKISNLEKDLAYRKSRIDEIENQLKRYDTLIEKDKLQIKEVNADLTKLGEALKELYILKEKGEKELSSVEQGYYEERQKIKKQEDQLRDLSRLLQTKQVLINKQKESYNDVKFKIQSVGERLKIEFNISINDIINDNIETEKNIDELKEEVFKLRTKIERFGEVNPMAVETYEEMKVRYENITTQRDDILTARTSLESTIKEIEKQATEKFLSAFEQIRVHFIDVFRTLFTENDKCDLILLDENNPLESKIDIIAKPKGKRPQSLSQLSGGEKTLTATALLFALYLLKPAPFCIFDEIDAPLDDINIQKFNKLIVQFSKESQFIIITHNKDTMNEIGTMYGIFMQEPGISGISLVDFRAMQK